LISNRVSSSLSATIATGRLSVVAMILANLNCDHYARITIG
jgi:hypothetical protein